MKRFFVGCVVFFLQASICFASEGHDADASELPNHSLQQLATALFAIAILHTFLVGRFKAWAHHYPEGSKMENLLHLLGETEAVFVMWAAALFSVLASLGGWETAIHYIEHLNYTEPKFVFVIMCVAATRPVVEVVDYAIRMCARMLRSVLPFNDAQAFLVSALIVGPLLGSLVTEPAAMTVTSMVLKRQFFDRGISKAFMYALIGTLFVNVSIGGTLTNFAAPPILMVAGKWGWSTAYMLKSLGWKAVLAVVLNAFGVAISFFPDLQKLQLQADSDAHNGDAGRMPVPLWVKFFHLATLGFVVATSHHEDVFFGGFIIFLGFCTVTREFQESLKIRESLLVGGFLAGLVTMGGLQAWWLRPLLASLGEFPLYVGCTALTAVTDNAALTFLGSQVEGLSESMKYALVAGAVTGGGLTVIANAPNPAGYAVLEPSFKSRFNGGISPLGLLLGASIPTAVAFCCIWFLP